MLIKLMLQSPIRSISEPEFAYLAYPVLCPNRDIYVAFLRTNFNRDPRSQKHLTHAEHAPTGCVHSPEVPASPRSDWKSGAFVGWRSCDGMSGVCGRVFVDGSANLI
jgi:hypothetical protein